MKKRAATLTDADHRPADIRLPKVDCSNAFPIMTALQRRASCRGFAQKHLPDSVLSNLLWAANGVNRPDSGKRTAPSACNWQEIDIYVIRKDGAYLYDPKVHCLTGTVAGDLRPIAGVQPFVATAAVVLVYVADMTKLKGADEDGRRFFPACDTGYVSQNVYLYCASEGLATVALISVDKPVLHQRLGLRAEQVITLTQPIGYSPAITPSGDSQP